MAANRPLAIAIDLGGTQLRAALFLADEMQTRAALPTDVSGGPIAILQQMEALIEQVCEGVDKSQIAGVGLSMAGPVDTKSGIALGIPTLPGWTDYPIKFELTKRTSLPVIVENDAIASTLGEWRYGAGRGVQNLVYLTVSTGIGGGAVIDGRLVHGRKGMAAHIGHMRLTQNGPECSCGAIGCFEALASGTALAKRAQNVVGADQTTYLGVAKKNGLIKAIDVIDGARSGDKQCISLVEEEAKYLGQGITSLIHVFSPELVVIGGGMSQAFDLLEANINAVIRSDAMEPFKDVPVVRSALGDNSGLVGAATMFQVLKTSD